MKILSRVLLVAIAAGWMLGDPVTAQSKNPIEAAKEAFKKAREAQRPPRPQQPTPAPSSPATSLPAAAGAATECCSPEALSKLATSVGFIDIVGVKLGMTLEQAVAALKASNPKLVIDIHDGELRAGGKLFRRPRLILAHLPAGSRNPAMWGNLDGSHEAFGVQLTAPPGPMVVEMVTRYVSFPNSAPVAAGTLVEAHRAKYGQESLDESGQALVWIYDLTGRLLRNPPQVPRMICWQPRMGTNIRGEDASNSPGKSVGGLEQLPGMDEFTAKCTPYVVARAEIQHQSLTQPQGDFWTTIHSPGLELNSLVLMAAFVKQANENAIKQQEDAGAKRAAPKL
jgi:hypothetical protein